MAALETTTVSTDDRVSRPNPSTSHSFSHVLFALSLLTGGQVASTAIDTPPGASPAFDTKVQLQRAALLLNAGTIYVAFGANGCDADGNQYHGWVMAYDVTASPGRATFTPSGVFNSTPGETAGVQSAGGIWMSGAGPSVDEAGDIYIESGNGIYDKGGGPNVGDAFVKLHHDPIRHTLIFGSGLL